MSISIRCRLAKAKSVYFRDIYVQELVDNYYRFPGARYVQTPRDDLAVHLLLSAELLACYLLQCFVLYRRIEIDMTDEFEIEKINLSSRNFILFMKKRA